MHFRVRYQRLGAHVHVRLFSASRAELTHGKNGDLCFREEEWDAFLQCFSDTRGHDITVVPEERMNDENDGARVGEGNDHVRD